MKKNLTLKTKPLALLILGGITVFPLSVQATTNIKENVSDSGDTKTYSYVLDSTGTTTYISKTHTADKAKLIFNVDGSNLAFTRDKTGADDEHGALGLTVKGKKDTLAGPVDVNFNISNFASVTNTGTKETQGVFLSTEYEGDESVTINTHTTISGDEERTVTAKADPAADTKDAVIALEHQYNAPGSHTVVINTEAATYKASSAKASDNIVGIHESIQHQNNTLDFDFQTGNVDVTGEYDPNANESKVAGIKVKANNTKSASTSETETATTVNIKVSGGSVKAVHGKEVEGVSVKLSDLVVGSSNLEVAGGSVNISGGKGAKKLAGSYLEVSNTKDGGLSGQVATNTQSGGMISVDLSSSTDVDADLEAYGIAAITNGEVFKSQVAQDAGTVDLSGTQQSNKIAAALYSESNKDAKIIQGQQGIARATGENNAVAVAKSTTGDVTVNLAGLGEAKTYGVYTETSAEKTSTINLSGNLIAETAVANNEGKSVTTIAKTAHIGSNTVTSKFSLGGGEDSLTFEGNALEHVGDIDGGDDFDHIVLQDYTDLAIGNRVKNFEKVDLKNGTYTLADTLTLGNGTKAGEEAGLNIASDATLTTDGAAITGAINNEGTATFGGSTTITGAVKNKANATATLDSVTVSDTVENAGTLNVDGESTVTNGLHNTAEGTLAVNAKLTTELANEGTASLNNNAEVVGNVTNDKALTLANGSKVTGTLENNADATVIINQAVVSEAFTNAGTATLNTGAELKNTVTNQGTLTIAGSTTAAQGLDNQGGATVNVNAALTGNIDNSGTANLNAGSEVTGNLSNKAGATANVEQSFINGDVENSGQVSLTNTTNITGNFSNKTGATATVDKSAIAGNLDNEGTLILNHRASVVGKLSNKANATTTLNQGNLGSLENSGTVTVNGKTTVTGGLTNNADATVEVNAKLISDLNNQGTANLNENAEVEGAVTNNKDLALADDSKITGTLTNESGATVTVNQANITSDFTNKGTATLNSGAEIGGKVTNQDQLTVDGLLTVDEGLDNQGTLTVNSDSTITGNVDNSGTATINSDSTILGNLNNKAAGTLTLDQVVVTDTVNNEGTLDINGDSTVTSGLNNKASGTVNVNAALESNINNQGTVAVKGGANVRGSIANEKDLTLEDSSLLTGDLSNKADATAVINQATITGDLENQGTATLNAGANVSGAVNNEKDLTIAGDATVASLNNKADANLAVNAALTGDVNNQGTATVANGAKVLGTINNEQTLTLEDGSSIEGTLNNKADATATINQVTITEDLNNAGTATLTGANIKGTVTNSKQLTVAGDSTVGSLTNEENATVEVNADLTGDLTNKGTANVASQTLNGSLANEATGTLNLNSDTTVTGTLDNQGKAVLGGTIVIKSAFTNTGTAVLAGDITADNGLTNEAGAKLAIDKTYAGNLTNKGETIISGTQFTGNLTNEGTAQLKDGLNLAGVLTNTGTTKVDGQVTVSSLNNNSVVDLRSETAGQFNTLTVAGDLEGNGTVKVNVELGGDSDSQHDTLAVNGNVNGTTTIEVTDVSKGAKGTKTIEGIEIVKLADSSQVADPDQAFKLLAPVEAGIYEYNTLAYNTEAGKKGFYLRSVANRTLDVDGKTIRLYRPAVAAYALSQQINSQALHNLTSSLHQRKGEQKADVNFNSPRQTWIRMISNKGRIQADNLLADSKEFGIQLGWDFNFQAKENRLGLYGAYNKVESKIGDSYRALTDIPGKIDTDLTVLGIYNTTYFGNKYVNFVASLNYLHNSFEVLHGGSQNAFGGLASVEVGNTFSFAANYFFEPQLQLSYQFTHYQDFKDVLSDVQGYNHQSLRPKLGFRLGYHDVKGTNLWLHANVEFEALKPTNFYADHELISTEASTKGMYSIGLGGQKALTANIVIYGNVEYQTSLRNNKTTNNVKNTRVAKYRSLGAEAGLRLTW